MQPLFGAHILRVPSAVFSDQSGVPSTAFFSGLKLYKLRVSVSQILTPPESAPTNTLEMPVPQPHLIFPCVKPNDENFHTYHMDFCARRFVISIFFRDCQFRKWEYTFFCLPFCLP